jgi:N-acetylglucosamine-6-sulfatase
MQVGERNRWAIGSAAVLIAALAALIVFGGGSGAAKQPAAKQSSPARPNVVVIMTDDQTVEQQRVMNTVNSRIGARGAVFRNAFTNFALCCPSRATFLTGQYAHNDGVRGNSPPEGGYEGLDHTNTLPVWLQKRNYFTSNIGKYLNGYEGQPQPETIPPGWSDWETSVRTYTYYDYNLNVNGSLVDYGHAPADYKSDVYSGRAVDLINERAGRKKPLFLWLNYLSPHSGGPTNDPNLPGGGTCQATAKPAPRDAGKFSGEQLPGKPSFNEADTSDKPAWIRDEQLTPKEIRTITRKYRCRLESVLAADQGAGEVLDALRKHGELKNTYVIYTSDNGFMHGEHRVPTGKNNLYEEAIHVPLMVRGPGIEPGTKVDDLVSNADIAPTITDLTGATPERRFDGRSLQPLWRHPGRESGRELLIQARYGGPNDERNVVAVRNHRYIYGEYENGDQEMYDLISDPYELENIAGDPGAAAVRDALAARLASLRDCAGASCRTSPKLQLRAIGQAGRKCVRNPLRIGVVGDDAPQLTEVRFTLPGGAQSTDTSPPFRVATNAGRFSPAAEARARAQLLDGREVLLRREFEGCK